MSFSSDLKNELCQVRPSGSQKPAECYGLLLYSRGFSFENLSILTEHEEVALRYARLLRLTADVSTRVVQSGSRKELLCVSVPSAADRAKILHLFGYTRRDERFAILPEMVETDADAGAFLRGAFLACGSIANPTKEYHLEFCTPDAFLGEELRRLLSDHGFAPRVTARGKCAVVYFKESGQIEDLLTLMGGANMTLELMQIKVYKDFRNRANRLTNAEVANIGKTIAAAAPQVEAARFLWSHGLLEELSPELREAAELRLQNPELSLRDLAALCAEPVTRSGLNHRLTRLCRIAEEERRLRGEGE